MKHSRIIENLVVRHVVVLGIVVILLITGSISVVLLYNITGVTTLATLVDTVFKSSALLVGCLWALNRFFVNRLDETQMKVIPHVTFIPESTDGNGMMLFHIEVINTGSILIRPYQQSFELSVIRRTEEGFTLDIWHRWPEAGADDGGPIEPKSLAAIDDAISLPSDTVAVKMYLEMHLADGGTWTWHRTFRANDREEIHV